MRPFGREAGVTLARRGIGFVVFEHRDQAESLMCIQQSAAMELPPGVTLESATVYEVQGEA